MKRAVLIVLDSVGIGGADDAAEFGDAGADTLGHIAAACADGRGDARGIARTGRSAFPTSTALASAVRPRASTGGPPPDLGFGGEPSGRWGFGVEPRRARIRRRVIGRSPAFPYRSTGATFHRPMPAFPAALTDGSFARPGFPASSATSMPPGTDDHRRARRGAYPDRQADLLHLDRFGLPDRRA